MHSNIEMPMPMVSLIMTKASKAVKLKAKAQKPR